MSDSKLKHQRLNSMPNDDVGYILDTDTIELFNRDTLYLGQSNQSLLGFFQQKHLQFQKEKFKLTIIFISIIALFSVFSVVFLLSAIYNQDPSDNYVELKDNQNFRTQLKFQDSCRSIALKDRIDCNPDQPISQEICEQRGCCWNPVHLENRNKFDFSKYSRSKVLPPLNVPYCFYNEDYVGYKIVKNVSLSDHTKRYELERKRPSGFPRDVEIVVVDITELSDTVVRIKIFDLKNQRYEVPVPKLNLPHPSKINDDKKLYSIEIEKSNLIIKRRSTGKAIFDVNLSIMVFSDQMIQITNRLPSEFLYGLGEHREPFRKATNWKRYTMFNRDQYPLPDMALYGSHPFYMSVEEYSPSKPASGVFLFNSNAMDVITQPQPSITFRTIGGILDFFVFFGPRPEEVVQQYHQLLGLPLMPPYWSLGFHLSRYGYNNMSNLNATFMRNFDQGVPLDVQWTDIDMMHTNNDFTYDKNRFAQLPDFIDNILHKNGLHFIPMFDAGISAGEQAHSYPPYDVGLEMNVFVKNFTNQLFFGKVWNTKITVWPDFFHPNATDYYAKMMADYYKQIKFDGAWIDMNEPSNFLNGQYDLGCPMNTKELSDLESPKYIPGMTSDQLTLRFKTLCMSARHYIGLHYNLHNLYGFQQAIITNEALKKVLINRRPFIISRSSAPGHGHFAYHWDGDIVSDWPSMKWSLSSVLNFQLFGIPMVGADICGFNGNTTFELCARWHQLGAFYTFSRNHNTDNAIDQDPAAFGPQMVTTVTNAFSIRYAHLPYLYTLFHHVHRHGGTVLRPLFFEFGHDDNVYKIDSQFMWGHAMMIAPVLEPNQKKIKIYFPKGRWFFVGNFHEIVSTGQFFQEEASMSFPNVYYRSGSVIPIQKPKQTTEKTRKENFSLIVTLENERSTARGHLYWDMGDGLDTKLGRYNLYDFKVENQTLIIESKHLGYEMEQSIVEIIILGFQKSPKTVKIDGKQDGFHYRYDNDEHRLTISDINLKLYNYSSSSSSSSLGHKIHHNIYWDLN